MEELASYQLKEIKGTLKIRNVSNLILSLANYDRYSFDVDEVLDLLGETTPAPLRASDYDTAKNMVGEASVGKAPQHTNCELAMWIEEKVIAVVEDIPPKMVGF